MFQYERIFIIITYYWQFVVTGPLQHGCLVYSMLAVFCLVFTEANLALDFLFLFKIQAVIDVIGS